MDILKLAESKSVIIYGAHLIALELYRYLEDGVKSLRFEGFSVTSIEGNPENLEGHKVRCIEEYSFSDDKIIFVAMPRKYHKDVESHIRQYGFDIIYFVDQEKMEKLKSDWILKQAERMTDALHDIYEDAHDKSWLNIAEKNQYERPPELRTHFKFPTLYYKDFENVWNETEQFEFKKEYGSCFGTYYNLHDQYTLKPDRETEIRDILKIYMVFSQWDNGKKQIEEFPEWIVPIQAGSILTENKSDSARDEIGENISALNGYLAELTAAYWLWKNESKTKYKGLCHYRRHFIIGKQEIYSLEKNQVEVILTTPRYVPGGVGNMFLEETPVKRFVYDNMIDSVAKIYPEESRSFLIYMKKCLYCPNNMVIAQSRIYDAYCAWLFPVLFQMFEKDQKNKYGHEKDRHLAYAAELLTSYYFSYHKSEYKIVVTDYKFRY